jgi:hypothetical protein
MISGLRRRVNEIFAVLGCYAVLIGNLGTDVSGQHIGPIFKNQVVFLNCLTLEVGNDSCPETSVTNYQSTLRNIPEKRRYYLESTVISLHKILVVRQMGLKSLIVSEKIKRCMDDECNQNNRIFPSY